MWRQSNRQPSKNSLHAWPGETSTDSLQKVHGNAHAKPNRPARQFWAGEAVFGAGSRERGGRPGGEPDYGAEGGGAIQSVLSSITTPTKSGRPTYGPPATTQNPRVGIPARLQELYVSVRVVDVHSFPVARRSSGPPDQAGRDKGDADNGEDRLLSGVSSQGIRGVGRRILTMVR